MLINAALFPLCCPGKASPRGGAEQQLAATGEHGCHKMVSFWGPVLTDDPNATLMHLLAGKITKARREGETGGNKAFFLLCCFDVSKVPQRSFEEFVPFIPG